MNIWTKGIGVLERADTNESYQWACVGIIAPDSDTAFRTPCDLLAAAGLRGCVDYFGIGGEDCDIAGFDDGVEGEGRAGFALAPWDVSLMVGEAGRRIYSGNGSSG
jgi:hypothetical protein